MNYKGYDGSAHFSDEDGVFHGKLEGIGALVNYEGSSVDELRAAFHEAVDDYLELCEQENLKPEKPFKGVFNVRTTQDLHRRAAIYADRNGKKLNAVVNEALDSYLQNHV